VVVVRNRPLVVFWFNQKHRSFKVTRGKGKDFKEGGAGKKNRVEGGRKG